MRELGSQELRDALLRAIYERALALRFQPVTTVGAGTRRARVEIGWRHPDFGWLDRAAICAVARSAAAIQQVDIRVLAQTTGLLRAWRSEPPMDQMTLVIPLSQTEVDSTDDLERILATHAAAGWPSRTLPLEFEIDRRLLDAVTPGDSKLAARLREMRSGFVLRHELYDALDPVAAESLPVRTLQIDVSSLVGSADAPNLVRQCSLAVESARSRGLEVIATGVDTVETLRVVADAGIDAVQGSITGGGMSVGELEDYVTTRNLNTLVNLQASIVTMRASG